MRSLTLRIYVTVVAALALFALGSGWLVQRHFEEQRGRVEAAVRERGEAWGDLIQRALPSADAPAAEQAAALRDWSLRLRVPMALDDAKGVRIGASDSYIRRGLDNPALTGRVQSIVLDDGRVLRVTRPAAGRGMSGARPAGAGEAGEAGVAPREPRLLPGLLRPPRLPEGVGLLLLLVIIFLAVAAGSWPVVRRLTRRLEALKQGVEAFGAGALHRRVSEEGRDEVAALGSSFNRAATRIEALLRSHQSLLANASHELRSPLARLKMAVQMLEEDSSGPQRAHLKREIDTNIGELDSLVEEVLLASRLDGSASTLVRESVGLLAVAAEEAARVGAAAQGDDAQVQGDEKLLRRAVRNLLENARRYGGGEIDTRVHATPAGAELRICDRGPGVPEAHRERIFEAFFRLPGHAEREGGVGLGLALVRQIAQAHGGSVRCEPRPGGGSCFVLSLPRG